MHYSPRESINMSLLDRWSSLVGGALLIRSSLRRDSSRLRALAGAEMIRRGITGHCYAYQTLGLRTQPVGQGASISIPYESGVRARAAVTISKPRTVVYQFWRDFSNLPRVMKHVISIDVQSDKRSHWVAEGPLGKRAEWDSEIHNEIPDELIAWRSLPGADVASAGSVHFKDAPGGRGTEVIVKLQYDAPTGLLGATVAKLFGSDPETEIESDLFRLKQYLETGEVATAEGQPHGLISRMPAARAAAGKRGRSRNFGTREEATA